MGKKQGKMEKLVSELIKSELEAQLAKMVRRSRKRANREAQKLNDTLMLTYDENRGFSDIDAEVIEFPEVHETPISRS